MRRTSARKTINRLYDIRNRFGRQYALEKQGLLEAMPMLAVRTAADTKRLHKSLCFIRAFPDGPEVHALATDALSNFGELVASLGERQESLMADSGIRATDIHYSFSFEVAAWLAHKHAGITRIDWPEFEDTGRLDELLEQMLEPAEADYFDSGQVSTEEWLKIAAKNQPGTEFDWLMSQMKDSSQHGKFWTTLYNASELPLRCKLGDSALSSSANLFDVSNVFYRKHSMHNRVTGAKKQIASPLTSIKRLSRESGVHLIDVAMASLAVRHRETLHFNYANPNEIYVADVGRGVRIAITGLQADKRYPLECTMGFLILSNGVPIGYGGASVLFRQVNTGINIFDEYRGSEAAWLWVQVMRVFHSLTGCNRYIANPYQFGSENSEALQSGAFWFYYRLGYRPVEREIRDLAKREFTKIQANRRYRTSLKRLKRLAACDMHLALPGACRGEFFDEGWIEASALLATRQLAMTGELSRGRARRRLGRDLVKVFKIKTLQDWSPDERKWFLRLSPLIAETDPGTWSARERNSLLRMVRAKGGGFEVAYARHAKNQPRYFSALRKSCRKL